jgi:cyclic pyranopterin phosphate synthase
MTHLAPLLRTSVVDVHGRTLRYLRVSVTDRCNLRCEYCSPNGTCPTLAPEPLSWDDLRWMVKVAVDRLGVEALRITGGEPTVRPGLVEWVRSLQAVDGLADVSMTTNAVRLAEMAGPLAQAGLRRVNMSMDSLKPDRFRVITRGGDLHRVLRGIEEAKRHFMHIKINVVALKDRTTGELADFVAFSDRHDIEVRFIEPMPLDDEKVYWRDVFVPVAELKQRLVESGHILEPVERSTGYGPSTTFRVSGTRARLGFISQMSCTKCATCNKLRMTSDGTLRPCLLSAEEVPLKTVIAARDEQAFVSALSGSFLSRPREYRLEDAVGKSLGRSMQCIGG